MAYACNWKIKMAKRSNTGERYFAVCIYDLHNFWLKQVYFLEKACESFAYWSMKVKVIVLFANRPDRSRAPFRKRNTHSLSWKSRWSARNSRTGPATSLHIFLIWSSELMNHLLQEPLRAALRLEHQWPCLPVHSFPRSALFLPLLHGWAWL